MRGTHLGYMGLVSLPLAILSFYVLFTSDIHVEKTTGFNEYTGKYDIKYQEVLNVWWIPAPCIIFGITTFVGLVIWFVVGNDEL